MVLRAALLSIVSALPAGAAPATAQSFDSAYTRIGDCEPRNAPEGYEFLISFMACAGYGDWVLYVGATEQTSRLAFGGRNLDQQFSETPINRVGAVSNTGDTIEWRLSGERAFATILRWRAMRPGQSGFQTVEEYLVVTALEGGNSACHAAYVDVRTVPNANRVARRAADTIARDFQCGARAPFRIGLDEARRLMAGG